MTRIAMISDMHGNLNFKVPEADLLLIAGDICPASHSPYISVGMQRNWLNSKFKKWVDEQPVEYVIFIAGNHDWIWEVSKSEVPMWIPKSTCDLGMIEGNKLAYLEDDWIRHEGLKIYGTPWQPPFNNWAFNKDVEQLKRHWDNIPEDVDILLTHCPPYGILDETQHPSYPKEHIGDENLLDRIKDIKPTLSVFGHNHGENGRVDQDGIIFVNCAMVDERYKLTREPIIVEI